MDMFLKAQANLGKTLKDRLCGGLLAGSHSSRPGGAAGEQERDSGRAVNAGWDS